ncbi:hypothetical protein POM88_026023 [Heracleum sosnowskyi]|uniref:Uncharacterized protein n=1 Tax=Heracleum sosnowskyi TaxID=360622 RepID=A0AAD8MNP5_9APIA|nr:hypothetical protein POM88_026023 [Heracleum sosnowskyi]
MQEDKIKLWDDLTSLNTSNIPWALLGDFNTIQDLRENRGGQAIWIARSFYYKMALQISGFLERNADVLFTPGGLSDHSAAILNFQNRIGAQNKPFQFYNYWLDHPDFHNIVDDVWQTPVRGNPMFVLHSKLNMVKKKLVTLKRNVGSIASEIKEVREQLAAVQEKIQNCSSDQEIFESEKELSSEIWDFLDREESIAHQRSRVQWLELGDQNIAYFHKKIDADWNSSKILSLIDGNGMFLTNENAIKQEAVNYFKSLFTEDLQNYPGIDHLHSLITKKISPVQAQMLFKLKC